MSAYLVDIDGSSDLAQINLEVAGEEAGGSEFLSSSIQFHDGRLTNLAKFRELPPGTRPKPLAIILQGTPLPAATKLIWSGAMIVSSSTEAVLAHRQS